MQVVRVQWGHLLSPDVPKEPEAPGPSGAETSGPFSSLFTTSASHLDVWSMQCQTSGLEFFKPDLLDVLAVCRQEFNLLIVIPLLI